MHLDLLDAILISRSSHRFFCCSVVDVVAVVAALFSCSSLFIINTVLYIDLRLDDGIQPSMDHWRLVFVITITLLCVLVRNFCTGCCCFCCWNTACIYICYGYHRVVAMGTLCEIATHVFVMPQLDRLKSCLHFSCSDLFQQRSGACVAFLLIDYSFFRILIFYSFLRTTLTWSTMMCERDKEDKNEKKSHPTHYWISAEKKLPLL